MGESTVKQVDACVDVHCDCIYSLTYQLDYLVLTALSELDLKSGCTAKGYRRNRLSHNNTVLMLDFFNLSFCIYLFIYSYIYLLIDVLYSDSLPGSNDFKHFFVLLKIPETYFRPV